MSDDNLDALRPLPDFDPSSPDLLNWMVGSYGSNLALVASARQLTFTGRENDVVKASGVNVSTVEVEEQLFKCSENLHAHVVGLDDATRGNAGCGHRVETRRVLGGRGHSAFRKPEGS